MGMKREDIFSLYACISLPTDKDICNFGTWESAWTDSSANPCSLTLPQSKGKNI